MDSKTHFQCRVKSEHATVSKAISFRVRGLIIKKLITNMAHSKLIAFHRAPGSIYKVQQQSSVECCRDTRGTAEKFNLLRITSTQYSMGQGNYQSLVL